MGGATSGGATSIDFDGYRWPARLRRWEIKVKGRKRHLLVDVLGLLLVVVITPASVQDRDGADPILREASREYPSVKKIWVDGTYTGGVVERIREDTGLGIELVKRNDDLDHARSPRRPPSGARGEVGPVKHPT